MNRNSNGTPAETTGRPEHHWKFFRAGGFDQVRLDSGADLLALKGLDPKLWMALSAPTEHLEFPAETLACLDTDHDGHIRIPELLAAIDWSAARLRDVELLVHGQGALPLAAIDDRHETGRKVLASARRILGNLGTPDADAIEASAIADPARIFGGTPLNGDGVITALTTSDPLLQAAIDACGKLSGWCVDRSGEPGINRDAINALFSLVGEHSDWLAARPPIADDHSAAPMAERMRQLTGKIDDYFIRCRLVTYDPRTAGFVNGSDAEFDRVGRSLLGTAPEALAALPLARIEAGRPLPLVAGVNPAWAHDLAAWRDTVLLPLLGHRSEQLDEADWQRVKDRAQPLLDWYAARPTLPEALPPWDTLARWQTEQVHTRLLELIAADLALADEAAGVDEVRQLALYVRDLGRFACNFVNFRQFYNRKEPAAFQCGTLYLDRRSCELVVPVDEVGRHASLAASCRLFLVYCECRRGGQKRTIAAAMTDGDADQLLVGRNGVFVDRAGQDWDATIVRLIEHPISLRQAFWAPWRRVSRMIGEQLQKLAASKDQAVDKKAGAGIAETVSKSAAPVDPKAPPASFDVARFAGIFAAIGLAIGAIGTVAAALVSGFVSLAWWQMPLAFAGLLMIVSGPALILGWFKLRHRTLGPLLDANGWAINGRAGVSLPFGQSLTRLARLPDNAERALVDPYADKPTPWGLYLVLSVLLGVAMYFLIALSRR